MALIMILVIVALVVFTAHFHNNGLKNRLIETTNSLAEYGKYRDVKYEIRWWRSTIKNETHITVYIHYKYCKNGESFVDTKSITLGGSSQFVGEDFINHLLDRLPSGRFYVQCNRVGIFISEYLSEEICVQKKRVLLLN